jgi:hypothetical protein
VSRHVVFLACAALLALPQAAAANDFQTVYREYKRTGTIKPCKFSDKQLRGAERQTPPDVEQYAPSFLDALQAARERNASCDKRQAAPAPQPAPTPSAPTPVPAQPAPTPTTPTPTPVPSQPTPAPTVPAQPAVGGVPSPAATHPKRDESAPAPVWILAVLGGLALLAAIAAALAWWFGWSPERWTRPFRASCGEFAGRLADFRVELTDWIRTGH